MKTELVTSLKRKATNIIAEVAESRDPVLITQHGKPAAYLVDVETFEGMNQKLAILEGIGRGERAIEQGNTYTHQQAKKRLARWLRSSGRNQH
jgi:prevent-host-death family protein